MLDFVKNKNITKDNVEKLFNLSIDIEIYP